MSRTVVVTQSNYIPWRGYFDMFGQADEVIILDSVQYTRRDWRNRNIIKTANGSQWLTIPVETKGNYHQPIDDVRIADASWAQKHIRAIELNYRKAAAFAQVSPWLFEQFAAAGQLDHLSRSNMHLLSAICERLGMPRKLRPCTDIIDRATLDSFSPSERLAKLCQAVGATRYLSGPAAKSYLDATCFADAGIEVAWMDYSGYPDYPQCWGAFEPRVSVIDLLLNCGDGARNLIGRQGANG